MGISIALKYKNSSCINSIIIFVQNNLLIALAFGIVLLSDLSKIIFWTAFQVKGKG